MSGVERGERNVSIDNIERIAKGFKISAYRLLMPLGGSENDSE